MNLQKKNPHFLNWVFPGELDINKTLFNINNKGRQHLQYFLFPSQRWEQQNPIKGLKRLASRPEAFPKHLTFFFFFLSFTLQKQSHVKTVLFTNFNTFSECHTFPFSSGLAWGNTASSSYPPHGCGNRHKILEQLTNSPLDPDKVQKEAISSISF